MFKKIFFYLAILTLTYSCKKVEFSKKDEYKIVSGDSLLIKNNQNNKTLEEITILNGKMNGNYIKRDSKKMELIVSGSFLNNKKNGLWKYYSNKKIDSVYYFSKNNDSLKLDKNDYVFREIYFDSIKLYVELPHLWKGIEKLNENMIFGFYKDLQNQEFKPNIFLTCDKVQDNVTLQDYIRFSDENYLKIYSNYKLYEDKYYKVHNIKMKTKLFSYNKSDKRIFCVNSIFIHNGNFYSFMGSFEHKNSEFTLYKSLMYNIISNFKFTDKK